MTLTLQKRLALGCAVAMAGVVVVISVLSYGVIRGELRDQVDNELRARARVVVAALARPPALSRQQFARGIPSAPAGRAAGYVEFLTSGGKVVPAPGVSRALVVDAPARAIAAGRGSTLLRDETVYGEHVRVLTTPLRMGGAAQIALPLTDVDSLLVRLRIALGVIGIAGVALAGVLAALVAGAGLAPIRRLRRTAEEVAHTSDLSRRIQVERRDEVGKLASTFNEMLAALQVSRYAQNQLVTDASHELRTPLTALRTNLEVLCDEVDLDPTTRNALVRDIRAQLTDLSTTVQDVVTLARDVERQDDADDVRLDDVVAAAVDRASRNAPTVQFRLNRSPTLVHGRAGQLGRAVDNVLSNAAKWSPEGGVVEVGVRQGEVIVVDHGSGIPEDDLPRVFDRFFRGASSRSSSGSGLGLAIVRKVAEEHGGAVVAERGTDGGTIIRLAIPPSEPVSP